MEHATESIYSGISLKTTCSLLSNLITIVYAKSSIWKKNPTEYSWKALFITNLNKTLCSALIVHCKSEKSGFYFTHGTIKGQYQWILIGNPDNLRFKQKTVKMKRLLMRAHVFVSWPFFHTAGVQWDISDESTVTNESIKPWFILCLVCFLYD